MPQAIQGFLHIGQLHHFLQRGRVQGVRQMHHPVSPAYAPGDFRRHHAGLGFHVGAHAAAGRHHHHIHRRCGLHTVGHFAHGTAPGDGQGHAVLHQFMHPMRRCPANFPQHLAVAVRIAGHHSHMGNRKQPAQGLLQLRQAENGPAQLPGTGKHIPCLGRELHARRIHGDEPLLLERRRRRPNLPLGQAQPRRQRPPAHRLHAFNAGEHLGPPADIRHQIRRNAAQHFQLILQSRIPLFFLGRTLSLWANYAPLISIPYQGTNGKAGEKKYMRDETGKA